MAQTPRMPRRTNTNRLWSVTAYARASRRPTAVPSINCWGEEHDALPWTPMRFGMKRTWRMWVMMSHVLLHYKLQCYNRCSWLTRITMSSMCINESQERNIPEVMWNWKRNRISPSPCTVSIRVAQVNRVPSRVSTFCSTCMAPLQRALEGCRRQEALFQAPGAVS